MGSIKQMLPALAVCGILVVALLFFKARSASVNEGHLIHPLDDTYIHMAMARNLAENGVYGIDRHQFSTTSSSPLWTLLLALAYKSIGVHEATPAWLNGLFGIACILLADRMAVRFGCGTAGRAGVTGAILVCVPLVPVALTGMEHLMHLCWMLLLVLCGMRMPARDTETRGCAGLCGAGFLATATRYESLFFIVPFCATLLVRRQVLSAALLLASATAPVLIHGLVSLAHGCMFLPMTLIVKGHFFDVSSLAGWAALLTTGVRTLFHVPHLAAPCLVLVLPVVFRKRLPDRLRALCWLAPVFIAAVLAHLTFATTGWLYRYEAYLVGIGTAIIASVAFAPAAADRRRAAFILPVAFLALLPSLRRSCDAHNDIVPATRDIYEQQFQIARMIQGELPAGSRVAISDVGAIAFYADAHITDLLGLATPEIAAARRNRTFTTATIEDVLRRSASDYVIVATNLFYGRRALPATLVPAGEWKMTNTLVSTSDTVSFFGTSPGSAAELVQAMERHERRLPPAVKVLRRPRPPGATAEH